MRRCPCGRGVARRGPRCPVGAGDRGPAGVFALAAEEGRILLTEDKDFGEFAFRLRRVAVPDIVLLRIDLVARRIKGPRIAAAIDRFGERLTGHYTVVHENRFRTRPLTDRV